MQDLRLVAADERGSHLVLRSPDGEKYVVSIDERLRAAVRADRAHRAPVDAAAEANLRPREIQARIRAGATAEEIARATGVSVEKVRRFEGPVLAEREHVAELAQRSTVRRPGLDGRPICLADSINERLAALGIGSDSLGWDAWRADDGRWVVQVSYPYEERPQVARYRYDLRARSVVAENDDARWLCGELAQRPQSATVVARPAPLEPVAAPAPVGRPIAGPHRRGPAMIDVPLPMDAELVEAPTVEAVVVEALLVEAVVAVELTAPARAVEADEARGTGTDGTRAPRAPRSRRASIPAWDDIMFGSRRSE